MVITPMDLSFYESEFKYRINTTNLVHILLKKSLGIYITSVSVDASSARDVRRSKLQNIF
jgi:hypothetical protein